MLNWNDPQMFWLNVTNVVLGLVTLACICVVGFAVFGEIRQRIRNRQAVADPHVAEFPELGWTMADGGEPFRKIEPRKRRK